MSVNCDSLQDCMRASEILFQVAGESFVLIVVGAFGHTGPCPLRVRRIFVAWPPS